MNKSIESSVQTSKYFNLDTLPVKKANTVSYHVNSFNHLLEATEFRCNNTSSLSDANTFIEVAEELRSQIEALESCIAALTELCYYENQIKKLDESVGVAINEVLEGEPFGVAEDKAYDSIKDMCGSYPVSMMVKANICSILETAIDIKDIEQESMQSISRFN